MSTKGQHLPASTRYKISKANTRYTLQSLTKKLNDYLDTNPQLVTIQGFLLYAKIDRSTLEKFPQLKEHILNIQHEQLITRGLNKRNSRFEQFLLGKIHYNPTSPPLVQNNFLQVDPELIREALKLMD